MLRTYEGSIQRRVLEALFQSQSPMTAGALADSLSVNDHTVSGVLSVLGRVSELKEVLRVDKNKRPWTYQLQKGIPVDDIVKMLRDEQKKMKIGKVGRTRKPTSKMETEKSTILVDKVEFPKGTALRLTDDIIIAGIDVFVDLMAEVVKGERQC